MRPPPQLQLQCSPFHASQLPPPDEHPDDRVLRDREQPPLHEHEAAREALRILDLERGGVVGRLAQCEGRIAVGAERPVGVEPDAPRPAEDADVEIEDRSRIPAAEQDREERDDAQQEERDPQERQHDEVRDREQPLDEPEPAAQLRLESALDTDGVRGNRGHWRFLLFRSGSAYDERRRRVARDAAGVQAVRGPALDELLRDLRQAAELQ